MRGKRIGKLKEAAGICSQISINGGKEVFAYGVKAICEYSAERVRLRLCDMTLCVKGVSLTMKSYYNGAVCVCGEIGGVELER